METTVELLNDSEIQQRAIEAIDGRTLSFVARELGVSRQAVHQAIQPSARTSTRKLCLRIIERFGDVKADGPFWKLSPAA